MTEQYPINEIFYSLQGEGHYTGRPAVFVRFSGCNINCQFCDTDFSKKEMLTAGEILSEARKYNTDLLILTGGEPSLWIDQQLINKLYPYFEIAIETNGTKKLPDNIDWITLSPKQHIFQKAEVVLNKCNEIKIVWQENFNAEIMDKLIYETYEHINYDEIYIQPCDTGNKKTNTILTNQAIQFCLNNPDVRLSVQLHKLLNFK